MATQLLLDFEAKPLPDPGASRETSREAEATTDKTRGQRLVLEWLAKQGTTGATRDELCVALSLPRGTICPRCNELLKAGIIYETTERRRTRSGKTAVVLCVR